MADSVVQRFFIVLGRLGPYLLAFILGAFLVVSWFTSNFFSAVTSDSSQKVSFEVIKDESVQKLGERLEEKGIIKNSWAFYWLAKIRARKSGGKGFVAKSGEYELSPSMKPLEVIDHLSGGKTIEYALTLRPGLTVSEVARSIADVGLLPEEEANGGLKDQSLMAQLGIPAYTPEGYLFEGSFTFSKPYTARDIVGTIVKHSEKMLEEAIPNWKSRASELGFRPYEMLVLGSILEKEVPVESERAAVAAVYHNRLRIGMQLQSNAALAYGIPGKTKEGITKEDIQSTNPYNTYINVGLPPTPICSPSISSLKAALFPTESDALYYFVHPDGSVLYSATFKEHEQKLKASGLGDAPATEDDLPL